MVSKLLKGRGLWLQVSCKSFPTVYSWLRCYVDRGGNDYMYVLAVLRQWSPYKLSLYSYDQHLTAAKKIGTKKGVATGLSIALVFFMLFVTYSVSFW